MPAKPGISVACRTPSGRHVAVTTLPEPLPVSAGPLRRMKAVATACLVTAAGVYIATYVGSWAGSGYVRAASEAAMVGGLADWFAITALFRKPLHLPIPHTALIPTRKDAL